MKRIKVDRVTQINEDVVLEPGDTIEVLAERGKTATSEYNLAGNYTVVNYQGTNVVSFNDRTIILDPHGWWTKTTKRRMNQASEEHDLGYWVYQKNGQWYCDYDGRTIPFADSALILDR